MRSLLALLVVVLLSTGTAQAEKFPELTGRVVDTAGLLSTVAENRLGDLLERHEKATSNQVVVVTLPDLGGEEIADFGYQLGRHWGIGQADRDNGVLLIVAKQERKVRIEVGYGLEGDLPDVLANQIIEHEILPAFRRGDFETGISRGTGAILGAINGSYVAANDEEWAMTDEQVRWLFVLCIFAMMVLIHFISRRDAAPAGTDPYADGYSHIMGPRRLGGSGFGGGFGGGGGGGFSGGGGSFGGGGASGGW